MRDWETIGDRAWRIRWAGGDATLRVFPPFPGVAWPGVVEEALAEATGVALEPCAAGGLEGVTCRFALPGATQVDRTVALLHDERSFYAVRLDRRGAAPEGLLERAWACVLGSLGGDHLRMSLVTSARASAELLGFWG